MLNLRHVLENLDAVRTAIGRRGGLDESTFPRIASLAEQRRQTIGELETLRAKRNSVSASLANVDKSSLEFAKTREEMREVGASIKNLEAKNSDIETELRKLLATLPNPPHATTPDGKGEQDNEELYTWGEKPAFDFEPKDHIELAESLGIVDFERAARISGSRFAVLRGQGARLERALVQFMLDMHTEQHGYDEVWPPALVRDSALFGTGQLPKFKEDVFAIAMDWDKAASGKDAERRQLYLSPTAEVQLTNLHAGEILVEEQLPLRYTAYAPCFRSEAGSYGKDTRGLIRQHQFDKVELVHICSEAQGLDEIEKLLKSAEATLQSLGLHYRVVKLCAGDIGFAAQITYDIEVWLPGQSAYREISSCSWCGDFQAQRASIRYRPGNSGDGKCKPKFAHTLNGSGLAVGRTWLAILEQFQQPDGSVAIPEVLQPYLGGRTTLCA